MHAQKSSGVHLVSPPLSPTAAIVKTPRVPSEEKNLEQEQSLHHLPPVTKKIKSSLRSVNAGTKQKKNVHWAAKCKDNQNNAPPRPRARSADQSTMRPHSLMGSFYEMSQDKTFLSATAKIEVTSSRSKSTSQKVPSKRQKVENSVKNKHTTLEKVVHRSSSEFYKSAPKTSRSTRETYHAAKGSRTDDRSSLSKTLVRMIEIPPYAPDPPSRREPPPAPRPARLPTPDLPEIGHSPFCACDTTYCNEQYNPPVTPSELKIKHQMEAARAYIKNAR